MIRLFYSLLMATFFMLGFMVNAPATMAVPAQENPREWFFEFCRGQGNASMKACYCSADFVESNLFKSEFRALVSKLKIYLPLDQDKNSEKLERAYESNRLVNVRVSKIYSIAFDQEECLVLEPGGREYLARLALHKLYLSCKAFWADHGSKAQCSLNEVMDDEYGFNPWDDVKVVALGNEYDFKATAKHRLSDHLYEITADGEIKEVSTQNNMK